MSAVTRTRKQTRTRRPRGRDQGAERPGDVGFVSACFVAARADTMFSKKDLTAKPPNHLLRESPPRNLRNQFFWIKAGQSSTFTTPASPTPGQYTKGFYLTDVFDASNLAKIFDQYCIYGVTVSFVPASTTTNTTNFGMVTSIIDYSDLATIASASEAKSYSTSETSVLAPGKPHMRFIKPCTSQALYRTPTNGYGPERAWVDSVYPDCPHFGIKALFYDGSTPINVEVQVDYLIGFRSSK